MTRRRRGRDRAVQQAASIGRGGRGAGARQAHVHHEGQGARAGL